MNRQHATKPRSMRPPGKAPGLIDLDALVLAEIESLTGHRDRPRQDKPVGGTPKAPLRQQCGERPAQTSVTGDQPGARRRVSTAKLSGEPAPEDFGEGVEALFTEPAEAATSSDTNTKRAELLDTEERAFITRAVGFLSARPTADIILEHIWERLTADPDDCFRPPTDDAAALPFGHAEAATPVDPAGGFDENPEA
ncbi:hypothetical protein ABC977_05320 [Thioalkalicoccus limnaeus]|uniref:Uncharacterized protein n=1 Tax=Thioalkalicoccus limnaeus TaxID=120681 RepID=A0ABV4BE90_9GAMM